MSVGSLSKVRPWTPTPEQEACLRATESTSQFLQILADEVRQQYAGQWIAAKDCRIIASAPTMAELCDQLAEPDDPAILVVRLEKGVSFRWRHS